MASHALIKNRYRRANSCGTCIHCKNGYCTILCSVVQDLCVCDGYDADPAKVWAELDCNECMFGPTGDRSCISRCKKRAGIRSCFCGRRKKQ